MQGHVVDLRHLDHMISSARKRRDQITTELRDIDDWIVAMQEQLKYGREMTHADFEPRRSVAELLGRG